MGETVVVSRRGWEATAARKLGPLLPIRSDPTVGEPHSALESSPDDLLRKRLSFHVNPGDPRKALDDPHTLWPQLALGSR